MNNLTDPHQFCKFYDEHDVLIYHWVMAKEKRLDGDVWIMQHFFFNPDADSQFLTTAMKQIYEIAQQTATPVWPLAPQMIAYFSQHAQFAQIWYHQPA